MNDETCIPYLKEKFPEYEFRFSTKNDLYIIRDFLMSAFGEMSLGGVEERFVDKRYIR